MKIFAEIESKLVNGLSLDEGEMYVVKDALRYYNDKIVLGGASKQTFIRSELNVPQSAIDYMYEQNAKKRYMVKLVHTSSGTVLIDVSEVRNLIRNCAERKLTFEDNKNNKWNVEYPENVVVVIISTEVEENASS